MDMLRLSVLVVLTALFIPGQSSFSNDVDAESIKKARNFTLPNAQETLTRVKWPREKVVFLTFGDQGGSDGVQAWAAAAKERFGDNIEFVSVAWLEAIPDSMRGTVEKIITTGYPHVLMDWSGVVADMYKAQSGVPNVYLIDPSGEILVEYHQNVSDALLEDLQATYEAAMDDETRDTESGTETE